MSRIARLGLTIWLTTVAALAGVGTLPVVFAGAPMVTLIPPSLQFGKQAQGTISTPQKVALANSGNADLVITGIALGGIHAAEFAQTNDCPAAPAALPAGATCTIQVVFKPAATGEETAALSISDNAPGSPQSVPLSGTATPPAPAVKLTPANLNFGDQAVGTASAPQTITLANTGSAALNLTGNIAIGGENAAEFKLVAEKTTCPVTGGQLQPGVSCVLGVSFAPATLGAKTAQVLVVDDAEGSPHAVPLAGAAAPK
jgi:hypothetical protein